jgi:hypothetical protein
VLRFLTEDMGKELDRVLDAILSRYPRVGPTTSGKQASLKGGPCLSSRTNSSLRACWSMLRVQDGSPAPFWLSACGRPCLQGATWTYGCRLCLEWIAKRARKVVRCQGL